MITRICAIAKDEAPYIADWVFHHLYFGFDQIHVYINRTTDSTAEILDNIAKIYPNVSYEYLDWIDACPIDVTKKMQVIAYAKDLHWAKENNVDWWFCLDIDETWVPKNFDISIKDYLSTKSNEHTISFMWHNSFGEEEAFKGVTPESKYFVGKQVKTISPIHNVKIKRVRVHRHKIEDDAIVHDANGNPFKFSEDNIQVASDDFKGKTIALSGFGNVTWGVALKITELGGKVVTISGPDGYIYDEAGLDEDKISYLLQLRATNNDIVSPYVDEFPEAKFYPNEKPWGVKCDIAMPCATQNELNGEDAAKLVSNGVQYIAEVSNMGCTPEAVHFFHNAKILYGPGKAVNAGGVGVSGLEMSQNAMKLNWTKEEVDEKLHQIMHSIHTACLKYGTEDDGYINYVKGANIAGFIKVADSMIDLGVV